MRKKKSVNRVEYGQFIIIATVNTTCDWCEDKLSAERCVALWRGLPGLASFLHDECAVELGLKW